jgi:hypothetical protein
LLILIQKKKCFVTNLVKINIFRFSSITRLEHDLIRHVREKWGHTDVKKVLPSAVDNDVIKPPVKLRQSNIKLLECHMRKSSKMKKNKISDMSTIKTLPQTTCLLLFFPFLKIFKINFVNPCSIKLCCLLRFDDILFVFKYWLMLIVLWHYTSTLVRKVGTHRCEKSSPVCRGQWCKSSYKKSFFVTNLFKINIFWFSSITRLKQDLTRRVWSNIKPFKWWMRNVI